MELKCVDSPFTRYRLTSDGTEMLACGYDWGRAALHGHRPLPQQQQKQPATPEPAAAPQHNTQEQPRDEDDPRDHGQMAASRDEECGIEEALTVFKPRIRLPGKNWRLSKFGAELGAVLALHEFYAKDGIVVIPDAEKPDLKPMDAQTMRTAIEEYVDTVHYYANPGGSGYDVCAKTISTEDASGLLKCPQFISGSVRFAGLITRDSLSAAGATMQSNF